VPFRVALLLLVILAVLAAAAYYFLVKKEEAKLLFSEATYADIEVRALTDKGERKIEHSAVGAVGDYARSGAHEAAIVVDDAGNSNVLLLWGAGRTVAGGNDRKAAVAIAPGGNAVAYASYVGDRGHDVFSPFINEWEIRLVFLDTNETFDLGEGFAPGFFSRGGTDYLLFTTSRGVVVFNMGDRTSYELPLYTQNSIGAAASMREDGAFMVMRNFLTNRHSLFAVSEANGVLSLSSQGTVGGEEGLLLEDVAWKGEALYAVTPPITEGNKTITFWRIDPAAPAEYTSIGVIDSSERLRLISS
jgi:hypothetical protein